MPILSYSQRERSVRSSYKAFRTLQTRWSDDDIYGHLNNIVHYDLFDVNGINGRLCGSTLIKTKACPQYWQEAGPGAGALPSFRDKERHVRRTCGWTGRNN